MPSVHRTKSQHSKSNSRSTRKCLRPGPVGRNPYLNFLREFRRKCCGMTAVETVKQGAKAWNQLKPEVRRRYIEEAFYAPKRRRTMYEGVMKRRFGRMSSKRGGRRSRKNSRRVVRNARKSRRTSRSRSKIGRRASSSSPKKVRSNNMCFL